MCISYSVLVNINCMNTKEMLKELREIKKRMPDIIIKDIKVGFFKHIYIITNEAVSSGDKEIGRAHV